MYADAEPTDAVHARRRAENSWSLKRVDHDHNEYNDRPQRQAKSGIGESDTPDQLRPARIPRQVGDDGQAAPTMPHRNAQYDHRRRHRSKQVEPFPRRDHGENADDPVRADRW